MRQLVEGDGGARICDRCAGHAVELMVETVTATRFVAERVGQLGCAQAFDVGRGEACAHVAQSLGHLDEAEPGPLPENVVRFKPRSAT